MEDQKIMLGRIDYSVDDKTPVNVKEPSLQGMAEETWNLFGCQALLIINCPLLAKIF